MRVSTGPSPPSTDARTPAVAATLEPGARLGRFQVVRLIGSGGMGTVYEARDPELDRSVALKLLRREDADGGLRFVREAQALARLSHPNVVAVHEVGSQDGRLFLAMEYIAGATLADVLRERPASWRELIRLFAQAGRGLAAAHARGLVHRDFKPGNVLVDREGRVRVTDFGLARLESTSQAAPVGPSAPASDGWDETTAGAAAVAAPSAPAGAGVLELPLTELGRALGTPRYMAPEQRDGGVVTARSDQYSFCVALWEALFGDHRPGARDGLPRGRAPRWLVSALEVGLSHDPEPRHASMTALVEVLERTPVRRRRIAQAGALAALVAGTAAASVLLSHRAALPAACRGAEGRLAGVWDGATRERMRASFAASGHGGADDVFRRVAARLDAQAASWTAMYAEACEATEVRREQSPQLLDLRMSCLNDRRGELQALTRVLAGKLDAHAVDGAVPAATGLSPVADCSDVPALLATVPPPQDPRLRARIDDLSVRVHTAEFMGTTGPVAPALVQATDAARAARALGHPPLTARALLARGQLELRAGDTRKAQATLEETVQIAAESRDDGLIASVWLALFFTQARDVETADAALALAPVARAAVTRAGGAPVLQGRYHRVLASALRRKGRMEDAITEYRRGLDVAQGVPGLRADLLTGLADALRTVGKSDEALAALQQALVIYEREYGPESHGVSVTLTLLAEALQAWHRCDEAMAMAERSVRLGERVLGPDSTALVLDHLALANVSACAQKEVPARTHYLRALALAEQGGADSLRVADVLVSIGYGLITLEKPAEAVPYLTRAVAIREQKGDKVYVAPSYYVLGEALLATGEPAAAKRRFEQAIAMSPAADPVGHAAAMNGLGKAEIALGHPEAAIPLAEGALAMAKARTSDNPDFQGDARMVLAEALWTSRRDRRRAVVVAREALEIYTRLGVDTVKEREQAAAWLLAHDASR